MDEREPTDFLQDPDEWDPESDELLPSAESPQVVVPVTFTPAEFAAVARSAREQGIPASQSIRAAMLARLEQAEPLKPAASRR
jgi:hypothetical protein